MSDRGAFEDAMDVASANVRWMQVREEKSSKGATESFYFDAQGRRFNDLHDIQAPVGLDFGGNWIPVISVNDSANEGWAPCSGAFTRSWERRWKRILKPSDYSEHSQPMPIKSSSNSSSAGGSSSSWSGSSGRLQLSPAARSQPATAPLYVESLYGNSAHGPTAHRGSSSHETSGGGGVDCGGGNSTKGVNMSVSGMEQKLAELLLLSNSPDIDAGRIMAAAASLKRDADVVLQDPSLTLLQRTAFRKLRDGVDKLQQTVKSPRMQRAAAAAHGTSAAVSRGGGMQASVPHAFAQRAPFVGSEEVDDDWTPRAQNFTQQQPLLQQQQLHVLRLQQEELDFEAGVAEDRRSNLAAISKDAAQVYELFREVAQCVQQGGEQIQYVDQMVDDTHAETREGARNVYKASTHTSSNIGIGAAVGGAIGAGVGTLLGPVGIAAIGSATAVVGGAIAKGVNVLKQRMVQREAKKAGINLDED